ncbi:MAG: efflux RND transporter periplasmic adaptor subunit [Ignavibacteriaceae bacterium]
MANGSKKKSKKKLIIFGGLGLLVLVLIIVVIAQGNKEEIITVITEKVQKRSITQTVTATGNINSEFQVIITPEVTGEIVALAVKDGDFVKKGQLLFKIKADTYLAAKERAEAGLLSSKASLSMSKAELDKISADYNRVQEMHIKKLASDSELEASKSAYLTAKARYESALAGVQQMEAALRESREQLNKTTMLSPMEGTVTALNVEVGERVLGSGFTQGTNVMTISDLESMEATVEVDENDIPNVTLGDTTRVKVDAFGEKVFDGIVSEIGNSAITSAAGTQEQVVNFQVKIRIIDQDKKLRPGMSCSATIETETRLNVLSVPIQSVTARSDFKPDENSGDEIQVTNSKKKEEEKVQEIVFIIQDGKAKTKNVKTGISDDNYIEIINGLDSNEEVVSGSYKAISRELKEGSIVTKEDKTKKKYESK